MKRFIMLLTFFRLFAGPIVFFLSVFQQAYVFSLLIFTLASISDYLDGLLARKYNHETSIGAILDPIADKILALFALFSVTIITNDPFVGLMSSLILGREFFISGLREYASQTYQANLLKVTLLAKTKTAVQFIALFSYFLGFLLNDSLIIFLSNFILLLATFMTFKTGLEYTLNIFFGAKDLK